MCIREWSGVEWSGVKWSGVEWSGVEWSGVEWSGVEWSGVKWRNRQSKGAICHQTTKNHPVLAVSLNKTLGSFSRAVDGMNAKEANLTNYRKIVQILNDSVEGSGNLLNQKSIAIVAGCGRASDANWLKHCIPGSSHHFTRLKQYPFLFTNSDQVMQLAHCLSSLGDQNGPMNGPKVDEVICKTLKGPSSDAMFHDIVIAGQDLFSLGIVGPTYPSCVGVPRQERRNQLLLVDFPANQKPITFQIGQGCAMPPIIPLFKYSCPVNRNMYSTLPPSQN